MTWTRIVCTICLCGLPSAPVALGSETAEREAMAAAEEWLKLVDRGDYRDSWREASALFKRAITADKWVEALESVRSPLGKLTARKVKSRQLTTTLPGAPDGEYVVIQFETSFAKKSAAVETVTPMKDEDGKWRVSGYYIR